MCSKTRGVRVNGELIRKLRQLRGLTQDQLASTSNLDVTTVRKMEKAERTFDMRSVAGLATALQVNVVTLLVDRDDDKRSHLQERDNLQCIVTHRQRFLEKDLDGTLACYTDDAIVTFPSSIPSAASGRFEGKEAIREHLRLTFQTFTPHIPTIEESDVYCFEHLIIVRHIASAIVHHNGAKFESECLLEFWFRDGKIYKHVGLFDTAAIAEALNAPPAAQ